MWITYFIFSSRNSEIETNDDNNEKEESEDQIDINKSNPQNHQIQDHTISFSIQVSLKRRFFNNFSSKVNSYILM